MSNGLNTKDSDSIVRYSMFLEKVILLCSDSQKGLEPGLANYPLPSTVHYGREEYLHQRQRMAANPPKSKPSLKTMLKLSTDLGFQNSSLLFFSLLVGLAQNQQMACYTQTVGRRQEAISHRMPQQRQITRLF